MDAAGRGILVFFIPLCFIAQETLNPRLADPKSLDGLREINDTWSLFLVFISSDRSSYSDVGLLHVQLFQIFTQSIDAIDVTSVTLSRLNSINAIDVTRYLGDIFGISLAYLGDILGISWGCPLVH